nr:MAG TPA: hypothetical protein [Bacteriophage sp.]
MFMWLPFHGIGTWLLFLMSVSIISSCFLLPLVVL